MHLCPKPPAHITTPLYILHKHVRPQIRPRTRIARDAQERRLARIGEKTPVPAAADQPENPASQEKRRRAAVACRHPIRLFELHFPQRNAGLFQQIQHGGPQ